MVEVGEEHIGVRLLCHGSGIQATYNVHRWLALLGLAFQTTPNNFLKPKLYLKLHFPFDMEPILYIDRTEEGELFDPKPQSSEFTERELGLHVYKTVWKEFYEWKPGESQQILDSLAGRRVPGERERFNNMIDQIFDPAFQDSAMHVENPNQPSVVVTQYNIDGRGISYPLEMEEISVDHTFESHPPYESCPPINQSITSNLSRETATFIPYGDEEGFPVIEYLERFEHLEWEEDFDPDCEP